MENFKLPDTGHWVITRGLERRIRRSAPKILNLEQTVGWIKEKKPLLWIGSVFSTPRPSAFPSGRALTISLLEIIFADAKAQKKDALIQHLADSFPLELLLDEFDLIGYEISESMLDFFNQRNKTASPNLLHLAVVLYYKNRMAVRPICITSNWDNLLEKSFRENSYKIETFGPSSINDFKNFGRVGDEEKTVHVLHPHGSFETRDVICSFKQEQRRLMKPMSIELMEFPTLFLGYSGYEPSLYETLETGENEQLWCIHDHSDLDIPAKRRLLSRPNVSVFIGDLRNLFQHLGILRGNVDFTNMHIGNAIISEKATKIVRLSVIASLDIEFAMSNLSSTLLRANQGSERTLRAALLMKSMVNHIRNRSSHPGILSTLLAYSKFFDTEQLWITILAFLLRNSNSLDEIEVIKILRLAGRKFKPYSKGQFADLLVFTEFGLMGRGEIYRKFCKRNAGVADAVNSADEIIRRHTYISLPMAAGDLPLSGEFAELLAFEYMREGKLDLAENCFDYAATQYYLSGLRKAGELNEWASKNAGSLISQSNALSLIMNDGL